jgi:7,8-dihydropterin-6-yl-methyl-4-(beta-D-ribofuranosyl)aminobenzene 5'-phosphate synthase
MIRITIVYDNVTADERYRADFGFACVVERSGRRFLFDTGANGEILLDNMDRLGFQPSAIDAVVVSHDHWDHVGGLPAFLEQSRAPVYFPSSMAFPYPAERAIPTAGPAAIAEGVYSTGELDALDYPLKEQSLLLETPTGLVVVVGCAHPGVDSILQSASCRGRIRALIGGLHGFRDFARLSDVELVCATHCTMHRAEIAQACGASWVDGGVGTTIELDTSVPDRQNE